MAAGKEIKRLRGRVSAAQAATLMGVDVERLRKWEMRDADPKDTADIAAVESFFKVSLSDLPKLDNFQFVPREAEPKTSGMVSVNKQSLEKSIENLTENELRNTAIIERLVTLLERREARVLPEDDPRLVGPGSEGTSQARKNKKTRRGPG